MLAGGETEGGPRVAGDSGDRVPAVGDSGDMAPGGGVDTGPSGNMMSARLGSLSIDVGVATRASGDELF